MVEVRIVPKHFKRILVCSGVLVLWRINAANARISTIMGVIN